MQMQELREYVEEISRELREAQRSVDRSLEIRKKFDVLKQKTLNPHTRCDYGKNEICQKHLCAFVIELHSHYEIVKESIIQLDQLGERLWVLSTRYTILESGKPYYQIYPEIITKHVICEIINEKNDKMNQICKIINDMLESYNKLDDKRNKFINNTKTLDWNTPAAFIVGDQLQRPLEYYVNGSSDLLFYFQVYQSLIKRTAREISIECCDSLKKFQKSLKLDGYFLVYLNALMHYSNCLPNKSETPKTEAPSLNKHPA